MPLPVIKWKKVGIAMLGFAWHLFRFYFLMSVTCTVTVQLLNAAFFVPSGETSRQYWGSSLNEAFGYFPTDSSES
jgi:hypothetical protein